MATQAQMDEASRLRRELGDKMPTALRYPLARVSNDVEVPGTADEVLKFAREVRDRIAAEKSDG